VSGCSPDATPMRGDTSQTMGKLDSGSGASEAGSGDGAARDGPSSGGSAKDGTSPDADAMAEGGDGSPLDGRAADATQSTADGGTTDATALCDPTHVWMLAHRIPSVPDGTDFARFGGIGVDELTIAWTTATGVIYTADRQTRTMDFDAPVMLPLPTTISGSTAQPAIDRVGLGPSGLTLVAVAEIFDDAGGFQLQLVGFERNPGDGGAYSAWVLSPSFELDAVNEMASTEQSGALSEPVVSGDGNSLFYVLTTSAGPTLFESKWDDASHAWATGSPALPASGLPGPTAIMRATGASSDGLTLFFYDNGAMKERAAWRLTPTSAFNQFEDEVAIPDAVPNFGCTTVYFQSIDTNGEGAFVAQ
jgi:hypothetical protein